MYFRKIQLIAGTTYSVSLPKEWVTSSGLNQKSIVSMRVRGNQTLVISPRKVEETPAVKHFEANIDEYEQDVEHILFSLFYTGFEDITLFSKKPLTDQIKSDIQRTLTYMSGTEVVYEDEYKIQLKVLLDTDKLNIQQIFTRISLLISLNLRNLKTNPDQKTIEINENEVDRLYHLLVKLISLSSLHPETISKSKMDYSVNILPYFLIAKRLEHLGDSIDRAAPSVINLGIDISTILDFLDKGVQRCISYLTSKEKGSFTKTNRASFDELYHSIDALREENMRKHLSEAVRCIEHIEQELVNVSFCKSLLDKGVL